MKPAFSFSSQHLCVDQEKIKKLSNPREVLSEGLCYISVDLFMQNFSENDCALVGSKCLPVFFNNLHL